MSMMDIRNGADTGLGRVLAILAAPVEALIDAWKLAAKRERMRRELESLSDSALRDIGLNRGQIDDLVDNAYRG